MAKEQNDFLDLVKFILALMVVAIHSGLYIGWNGHNILWPWLRCAVPLFFMMSSYFLFKKIRLTGDYRSQIRRFSIRIGVLYLCWFVVLLPITIVVRRQFWLTDNLLLNFVHVVRDILFDNTFPASWFLSGLMLAVWAVTLIEKWMGRWTVFLFSGIAYVWCTLVSSYSNVIEHSSALSMGAEIFENVVRRPHNRFLSALLWVAIGRQIALSEGMFAVRKRWLAMSCILFAIGLQLECVWRERYVGSYECDCYFLLIPLCVIFLLLLKRFHFLVPHAKYLRSLSVVVYVLHGSLLFVPKKILLTFGMCDSNRIFTFLTLIILCVIVHLLILRFERRWTLLTWIH